MSNIAIITGASSGIGKELVNQLNKVGQFDEVWAIARSLDKLEALKQETKLPIRPISLDLSDSSFINKVKELLETEKPNVQFLANCSGYGVFESFENITLENNLGMIKLNCEALVAMCHLCLPYMAENARILNIASVAAMQPIPYINVYGASKALVLSFTRALNSELKQRKIHAMALCPFWTKTKFFDRAVDTSKEAIVKKYVAMYEPEFIVRTGIKQLLKGKKDYYIPGSKARAQCFLCKILPHKMVMKVWKNQQKLK